MTWDYDDQYGGQQQLSNMDRGGVFTSLQSRPTQQNCHVTPMDVGEAWGLQYNVFSQLPE